MTRPSPAEWRTPAQVSHLFPASTGKRVSVRSIIRLIVSQKLRGERGIRGWYTTEAWVQDYLAEQTAKRTGKRPSATVMQRALRARAMLRAKGWVSDDATPQTA